MHGLVEANLFCTPRRNKPPNESVPLRLLRLLFRCMFILQTCYRGMAYGHMSLPTTLRSMASVVREILYSYKSQVPFTLTTSDGGRRMQSNWPQLNARLETKNEESLKIVPRVRSVRDLGIYCDFDLSMRTQVAQTLSCCFAVLR